ncbi:MAG: hypothetical protein ACKO40_08180 [Planctomycetaceae bacterium]
MTRAAVVAGLLSAVVLPAAIAVEPQAPAVSGDAEVRAPAGDSEIVIRTTSRLAGAIDSLTWRGREFIDSHDHGRQLQSASNWDVGGDLHAETFNPTEAGCERDGAGPVSTSRLLWLVADGRDLQTVSQMAFWLRPGQQSGGHPARNTVALSNHLLQKHVRLGADHLAPPLAGHAIRYDVTFTVPAGEGHRQGVFEVLTGYMPAAFRRFHALARDGRLEPLTDGPGEQALPVILATESGDLAMGAWSPAVARTTDRPATYGRFWFEREQVSKWNAVIRETSPAGTTLEPGTYAYRVWVAVGTLEDVRQTLTALRSAGR